MSPAPDPSAPEPVAWEVSTPDPEGGPPFRCLELTEWNADECVDRWGNGTTKRPLYTLDAALEAARQLVAGERADVMEEVVGSLRLMSHISPMRDDETWETIAKAMRRRAAELAVMLESVRQGGRDG